MSRSSSDTPTLARRHCETVGARLVSSTMRRAFNGVLLGDESSAWHAPERVSLKVGQDDSDSVSLCEFGCKLGASEWTSACESSEFVETTFGSEFVEATFGR